MGDIVAYGAVDEPAEFPCVELPGRTLLLLLVRALFDLPTFAEIFSAACLPCKQKEKLPLNMVWDSAPTLFIAAHCLERNTQEAGGFLLGFMKFFPDVSEFFAVHATLSSTELCWCSATGKNSIRW